MAKTTVGTSVTRIKKGRDGPIIKEQRTTIMADKEEVEALVGDGKAQVTKGYVFGESIEVTSGRWLKGDVSTHVRLTCDQSDDGILDAMDAAHNLARDAALDDLQELADWIDDVTGTSKKKRRQR